MNEKIEPALVSHITYFGQPATVACDALCIKAWGITNRPHCAEGFLADAELPDAPADPGTYEGGEAKPLEVPTIHNRWCVRECERSTMTPPGAPAAPIVLPDFSHRVAR